MRSYRVFPPPAGAQDRQQGGARSAGATFGSRDSPSICNWSQSAAASQNRPPAPMSHVFLAVMSFEIPSFRKTQDWAMQRKLLRRWVRGSFRLSPNRALLGLTLEIRHLISEKGPQTKQAADLEQAARLSVPAFQRSLTVKASTNKCSDKTHSGFLPSVWLSAEPTLMEGAEGHASLPRNFFKCAAGQSNSLGVNINFSLLTCETFVVITCTNHRS